MVNSWTDSDCCTTVVSAVFRLQYGTGMVWSFQLCMVLLKFLVWFMLARPFYSEEVRQPDVGSSGVGGTVGDGDQHRDQGSEEEPDN
ncbi:hypothetical protein L195_g040533 [Trifolium pratense]|uniref:Uncharacterized protein n=1 Tax=Trifolium pratense TaxID=57577 RepID=A0A2K3M127_TRIPR|nr:hypothetical protein L195_g040533 [Trifolium pratense]